MPIDNTTKSDTDTAVIGDADIAILCEVARASGRELAPEKMQRLPALQAKGLITESKPDAHGRPAYELTRAAQSILDERGVGVGEG